MKNLIIAAFSLLLFSSCKKEFIDLNPPSNLNSSAFYKTESDMNQAVLAAYGGLRSVYNGTFIRLGEIRSDNTTYSWLAGNPADDNGIDVFASPLLPENGYLSTCWNNCYNIILRCNIVIDRIDNVSFKNDQLKNQYIAEARFVRSLMYFWLNRVFGGYSKSGELLGVLKVDKEITPAEAYDINRSSLQEIYDMIVDDLKYAEQNLPDSYNGTDKGRVTKWGAKGLLTKVYMTMAGYPLNKGNGAWNTARIVAKGNHVEHWLNGAKVLEYERGSDAFKQAIAESKFKNTQGFATATSSPVLLQAHGDKVTYRNIKIKEL